MPRGLSSSAFMKPFVVLALPGMYLFYKYNQYRRQQQEQNRRKVTERELAHLNHKIGNIRKPSFKNSWMMLSCPYRRLVVQGSFSRRWFSSQVQTSTSTDVEEAKERGVNIALLGANGRVGTLTAMQLRTSPHIRRLALHDLTSTANLVDDLRRIPSPSKCQLRGYHGPLQLSTALKGAQIVLMVAGKSWKPGMSQDDLFALNAALVQNIAYSYATACPSAILGVITQPVNCNVPLVCEVMKREGKYNPDLIVGMATVEVVTANSIVGCTHNLDPSSVNVPMVGGASERTSVPILSQATPFSNFSENTIEDLTDMIRMAQAEVVMLGARSPKMTVSYSITRFALTLARGLLGYDDAIMCAYVRSNNIQTVPYLTNRIQFGPSGVMKNLGLPKMSRNELLLLGIALKQLQDDVKRAEKFCENYVVPEVMTV